MQKLIELSSLDAGYRFFLADEPFLRQIDRDFQSGRCRSLAITALQHPECAFLDGELDVLHISVVMLECFAVLFKFLERARHDRLKRRFVAAALFSCRFRNGLRRANASDHVLALCVDEKFAIQPRISSRWIPGEGDARRARIAAVAEHHRLNVHRGAPAFREVVQLSVLDGAGIIPAVEDRAYRAPELLVDVLRERPPELALHHFLKLADEGLPVLCGEIGIEIVAILVLVVLQNLLKVVVFYIEHNARVHLDEAAITIIGEAFVA